LRFHPWRKARRTAAPADGSPVIRHIFANNQDLYTNNWIAINNHDKNRAVYESYRGTGNKYIFDH
jgi:hypothetical protein